MVFPINELVVNWVTAHGGGFKSIIYMNGAGVVNDQRQALHDMLVAVRGQLSNDTVFFQDQTGRVIDAETGTLVGAWNDVEAFGNGGNGGVSPVADTTQVLIRWQTGGISNGRFVKGRQFIPGLVTTGLSGGNLSPTAQGVFGPAASALVAADVGMGVWHRPGPSGGGAWYEASAATVWNELAVLRRRRS